MTCLTLSPSWQSSERTSRQGHLLENIKSSVVILEKFLTATIMKVEQQWPREIRRISIFRIQ